MRDSIAAALRRLAAWIEGRAQLFAGDFRARYPNLELGPLETVFARAEAVRLLSSRSDDLSPVAKLPFKVRDLLQTALHRSIELARGFAVTCQGELFVPTFVIGRAIVETGALAWDTRRRVKSLLETRNADRLEELDVHVMNSLLGSKSTHGFTDPKAFPAPNVLTIIDRITKADSYDLRGFYDTLCEVAHPNLMGMGASYTWLNDEGTELRFHREPFRELAEQVGIAVTAAHIGFDLSVSAVELYNGEAGALAALCEEDIRQRGTWPARVPYPVPR